MSSPSKRPKTLDNELKKLLHNKSQNGHNEPRQYEIGLLLKSVPILKEYFIISHKIGEGSFSSVFLAKFKNSSSNVNRYVAIKHIIPTSHPSRVLMELECMQRFGGRNNVIGLHTCVRERNHVIMVMPYFHHDKFESFFGKMDLDEIRQYFYNLLSALTVVHAGGVIHRDIKPSNFLYCRAKRRYALVDFGLAQYAKSKQSSLPSVTVLRRSKSLNFEKAENLKRATTTTGDVGDDDELDNVTRSSLENTPDRDNRVASVWHGGRNRKEFLKLVPLTQGNSSRISSNVHLTVCNKSSELKPGVDRQVCHCFEKHQVCVVCLRKPALSAARAGTAGYRPPEVLLKNPHQTTAVDIWAAGVMLLSMLSERHPFFHAHDDMSALVEIISLFGTQSVKEYASKINKTLTCMPEKPASHLKFLSDALRQSKSLHDDACQIEPDRCQAYDLLKRLLDLDPEERISASDALLHPFFNKLNT